MGSSVYLQHYVTMGGKNHETTSHRVHHLTLSAYPHVDFSSPPSASTPCDPPNGHPSCSLRDPLLTEHAAPSELLGAPKAGRNGHKATCPTWETAFDAQRMAYTEAIEDTCSEGTGAFWRSPRTPHANWAARYDGHDRTQQGPTWPNLLIWMHMSSISFSESSMGRK